MNLIWSWVIDLQSDLAIIIVVEIWNALSAPLNLNKDNGAAQWDGVTQSGTCWIFVIGPQPVARNDIVVQKLTPKEIAEQLPRDEVSVAQLMPEMLVKLSQMDHIMTLRCWFNGWENSMECIMCDVCAWCRWMTGVGGAASDFWWMMTNNIFASCPCWNPPFIQSPSLESVLMLQWMTHASKWYGLSF